MTTLFVFNSFGVNEIWFLFFYSCSSLSGLENALLFISRSLIYNVHSIARKITDIFVFIVFFAKNTPKRQSPNNFPRPL